MTAFNTDSPILVKLSKPVWEGPDSLHIEQGDNWRDVNIIQLLNDFGVRTHNFSRHRLVESFLDAFVELEATVMIVAPKMKDPVKYAGNKALANLIVFALGLAVFNDRVGTWKAYLEKGSHNPFEVLRTTGLVIIRDEEADDRRLYFPKKRRTA